VRRPFRRHELSALVVIDAALVHELALAVGAGVADHDRLGTPDAGVLQLRRSRQRSAQDVGPGQVRVEREQIEQAEISGGGHRQDQ